MNSLSDIVKAQAKEIENLKITVSLLKENMDYLIRYTSDLEFEKRMLERDCI